MHKKYQSPLGRIQPNKINPEQVKKQGWKENGILVVNVNDDRLNWPEKELIKQIGVKIYKTKPMENQNGK
jgi:hypothetical protein